MGMAILGTLGCRECHGDVGLEGRHVGMTTLGTLGCWGHHGDMTTEDSVEIRRWRDSVGMVTWVTLRYWGHHGDVEMDRHHMGMDAWVSLGYWGHGNKDPTCEPTKHGVSTHGCGCVLRCCQCTQLPAVVSLTT